MNTRKLLADLTGQKATLNIPRLFIKLVGGDLLTAFFLSQLLYWQERTKNEGGWVIKSYAEWEEELCLSAYQVRKAIKLLKKLEIGVDTKTAKSKYHDFAPTIHYRLNIETLIARFELEYSPVVIMDNEKLDNEKTSGSDSEKTSLSYITETTTETTKEKDSPPEAGAGDSSRLECRKCGGDILLLWDDEPKQLAICRCHPLSKVDWVGYEDSTVGQGECAKCGKVPLPYFDRMNNKFIVCNCTEREDLIAQGFVEHPPRKDGDICINCESIVSILFDDNEKRHDVCNCTTDEDMRRSGYTPFEGEQFPRRENEPITAESKLDDDETPDPFQDNNKISTPVDLTEVPPGNDVNRRAASDNRKIGTKPDIDPDVTAAIPHNDFPRKGRLVNPGGDENPPVKAKPTKEQLTSMKDAILAAVGWTKSDVIHWGRIQKTATILLKKEVDPALLSEWQTWNSKRECGVVQNPEGIPATWPKFMASRRAKPAQKVTPELNIQVDEEYR